MPSSGTDVVTIVGTSTVAHFEGLKVQLKGTNSTEVVA